MNDTAPLIFAIKAHHTAHGVLPVPQVHVTHAQAAPPTTSKPARERRVPSRGTLLWVCEWIVMLSPLAIF